MNAGRNIEVRVGRGETGNYKISYEMTFDELQKRIRLIDEKINGLEQSVQMCSEQLALLRQEREQIAAVLNS